MTILVYLLPVALFLGLLGLAAFLCTLKNGHYDDLDGAAQRCDSSKPRIPQKSGDLAAAIVCFASPRIADTGRLSAASGRGAGGVLRIANDWGLAGCGRPQGAAPHINDLAEFRPITVIMENGFSCPINNLAKLNALLHLCCTAARSCNMVADWPRTFSIRPLAQ
jgi:cbb3-type cytochrome oxidase maturation protein